MDLTGISIILSVIALTISLLSLWYGHMAPYKLKACFDSPTFSIYTITPKMSGGSSTWWIPSIDVGFTFQNLGKKVGEIKDIRLRAILKTNQFEKKYVFYAKWIVDYVSFNKHHINRFSWIENSIQRDWYPLILMGNEQKSVHIIFEGGRLDRRMKGNMRFSLEIYSSENNEWIQLNKYQHLLTSDQFSENSTHTFSDKQQKHIRKDGCFWI